MVAQEAPAAANWYRTRLFVVPQLHSSVLPLLTSSAWPKSSMAFAGHDTTELKAKYRDAMCINPKLIIQTCAKHRKQHTSSARATPRQGPAGRRLLKRRLLMNFPKRNKQTTVQSLNARLSQPCKGHVTRAAIVQWEDQGEGDEERLPYPVERLQVWPQGREMEIHGKLVPEQEARELEGEEVAAGGKNKKRK